MKEKVMNFLRDEEGATAIEYGLIAALISIMIIGGATLVGQTLDANFMNIAGVLGG
jgi:pilus assembly protein Flp/PilA